MHVKLKFKKKKKSLVVRFQTINNEQFYNKSKLKQNHFLNQIFPLL